MKESNRALRRHHAARLRKNRRSYWGCSEKTPTQIGKLLHTAAICSCYMCGNPRHKSKDSLTFQECRLFQNVD